MSLETAFPMPCLQQSTGFGPAMVSTVLQALLAAQCAISPPELWPKDYGPTALRNGLDTYDFIVIGAGSAGSVVASRLSENPWYWRRIPNLFFTLQHTKYNWNYFNEPDGKSCLGYKNQVCYWPRGKMIGGTGGINGMLYIRGIPQDYEDWESKGNPNWGWKDVLPVFENSIELGMNKSECRGGLIVNPFNADYPKVRQMLYDAAEELGVPRIRSLNDGTHIGYTALPGTVENGRRRSTGLGYLAKAKNRPNLHVIKNALVTKIHFDEAGQYATGVTFTYKNNRKLTAAIAKEVILSAGTLDSAKLLMLSGIGPRNHLEKLHIPVVKNYRVGDNLQDHVMIPVFFKLNDKKTRREELKDVLDASYNYLTAQSGPLASHGTSAVTGLINSDLSSDSPYPDILYHHVFMASGSIGMEVWSNVTLMSDRIAQGLLTVNANKHILLVYVVLLRPKSSGTVRLRSTDPKDPPKIFSNYLDNEEDSETLLRGIKFQMEMENTTSFQHQDGEIIQLDLPECDQFPFKGTEYWKCYMKYMTYTCYHLTGTIKMGPDSDYSAVLDSRLRMKGIRGLRVADASIMPDIVSANTNAATIMIGERAAEFVKQDWGNQCKTSC